MKKLVSIILILLAISSFIGNFITICLLSNLHPTASAMEGLYYMTHYSWISWLFMLIPIGCLIFGALLKQKKNLVIGVICSCLLFGCGCFYLISLNRYSTNISYLGKLETELGVVLPNE